jgi:D-alanine-D-alanine ligase
MKVVITCEVKNPRRQHHSYAIDKPWDIDSEHLSHDALTEIVTALSQLGHDIEIATTHRCLIELSKKYPDLLCVNLSVGHGGASTKVYTAALLEILGVPYVGSPPYALAVTRDKSVAKAVAQHANIPTPKWQVFLPDTTVVSEIELPVIVKPIHESCSIGIHTGSIINDERHLANAVARIWHVYRQAAIIEQYVPGIDVEVPFIGDADVLGFVGVVPRLVQYGCDILTATTVYRDAYDFISPEKVVPWSAKVENQVRLWVRAFANATGIRDYGRLDFRVTPSGQIFFIEASTHPYLAQHSSFTWLYQKAGREYKQLWDELLTICMRRNGMITASLNSA